MKSLKWLHSRMWDCCVPSYCLGHLCPEWVLRAEERVAMRLPDSWFDQNN